VAERGAAVEGGDLAQDFAAAEAGERHRGRARRRLGDFDDAGEDQVQLAAGVALAEDDLPLLEDLLVRQGHERVGVGGLEARRRARPSSGSRG
jgi:hypothetical protein